MVLDVKQVVYCLNTNWNGFTRILLAKNFGRFISDTFHLISDNNFVHFTVT